MAGLSQELSGKREHRSALVSRRNVLNDLQNKREGISEAVRGILQTREKGQGFDYVRGLVSDIVSADLEHAGVIEAALGDLQNALIVTDSAALAADRDRWSKLAGRVTVIAADRMIACQPPAAIEGAAPVIDLITSPAADALLVHQMLGHTYITESLDDALKLAASSPREFRFVTRAGEVVESSISGIPTFIMGDMSKRGGMISRRAEVARLAWELEELEADIARLSERMGHAAIKEPRDGRPATGPPAKNLLRRIRTRRKKRPIPAGRLPIAARHRRSPAPHRRNQQPPVTNRSRR